MRSISPTEHKIPATNVAGLLHMQRIAPRAKWVATSGHQDTGACGTSWRHARGYREHLGLSPVQIRPSLGTLHHGDVIRVVEKVRTLRGLDEVKRTWGIGYKALIAELNARRLA